MLDGTIHQIKFIITQWISIRTNNCIVLCISIYPMDSAIHLLSTGTWTEEDNITQLWSGRELDKIR